MRSPVLMPSGSIIRNIVAILLLQKESLIVEIEKLPSRARKVNVEIVLPEWREYIPTEVKA